MSVKKHSPFSLGQLRLSSTERPFWLRPTAVSSFQRKRFIRFAMLLRERSVCWPFSQPLNLASLPQASLHLHSSSFFRQEGQPVRPQVRSATCCRLAAAGIPFPP